MKEFIDKIEGVEEGTDINRANLMAMQGLIGSTIEIGEVNGQKTVIMTNADGETLTTTYNADGTITQIFEGDKVITKTITIANGIITEVIE